jgi:hypothetical protein
LSGAAVVLETMNATEKKAITARLKIDFRNLVSLNFS